MAAEWVLDPNFILGCQTTSTGWGCNNGATIPGGVATISPEGSSAHIDTRLWDGTDDPPAGELTVYFTLEQITAGTGLRVRTTGNILQGQFTAGENQVTWTLATPPITFQFEVISGFGEWRILRASTVLHVGGPVFTTIGPP